MFHIFEEISPTRALTGSTRRRPAVKIYYTVHTFDKFESSGYLLEAVVAILVDLSAQLSIGVSEAVRIVVDAFI